MNNFFGLNVFLDVGVIIMKKIEKRVLFFGVDSIVTRLSVWFKRRGVMGSVGWRIGG